MKVTVSPYHRSVTIDGVEVRQKILEFPNALNHLASISCTYDKDSNTVVELSDMHRYVSHFTEREYFNTHLPEFVEWYYAEKQAQIEEEARLQKYKEDVENAISKTVEAGKEAQANIATDKADALEAIATDRDNAITAIQNTENGIITNITNVGDTTLAAINSGKNTALSEIVNARTNATAAVDQLKTEAVNNITTLNNNAIQSITNKQQEAEASIEAHRSSAQDAVDATGRENQEELDDKGTNYLNQTKEQVELAKEQADKAKEAADRATAVAEVGPATRNTLGLVKVGRGLEVNEEGLIEVRSSVTMLAPVVEAPDVLPLGYNSVFTMQAYPGLGRTNIKQYRCTLENVGTQVIDANSETGAGTVTFVVPKAIGENKTLKLTVVAIDTLDNESLPTELSRLTAKAFVNPPIINSPSTDTIIYPLEGFTATSGAFRTTALADTHEFTDWVIAKDNQANVIVVDIKNTTDLYSHTFTKEELTNKVLPNQTYYVFARYHGTILGVSELGSYKGIHAKPDTIKAPVISSPEALDIIYPAAGFTAETNSEFETIGISDTHVSTDWYITSDKEGKNIVASCLGSTDLKTHKFTPAELHNLEEQLYYVFCRFNGRDIGAGQTSDYLTIVSREAYIKAPVLNQRDYASVYPTGGIELSTDSIFESFGITDDTHKDTDWFIYQHENGTGIVAQALHSADLYSHTFPANLLTRMEIGKIYYVAARFNGEKIETGRLSAIETIATKGSYIHAPTIHTPVFNQDVYRAAGFTVTTNSVFRTTGITDEHVSSDWIISRDIDGLDIVVSAMSSEDLTSHTFTSEDIQDLEIGESYYVLMRFNGNIITKGNISEAVKVTVQPAAIKAPVINNLEDGTNCYYLSGLEVSTDSEFETIGLDSDEHISSDWIIAKDSAGRQVLAQVLNSSDLKSHFFSADDLEGMVDETDYYVFVRYNGAIISKGILSEPVRIVAKPAGVKAPEIIAPVQNSQIAFAAGVTITAGEFQTIGAEDTHATSDWKITSDAAGQDIICEANGSSDLTSHTFPASEIGELDEGSIYYAWVRYNGTVLGNGIWASVAWEAMAGIVTATGRFVYRHESDKGSVIRYDEFGYTSEIFVADAAYRASKKWGQYNVNVPGLNEWEHTYYPTCTANKIDDDAGYVNFRQVADLTPYKDQLTDAHFQAALTATLAPVIQSAKAATDILMNYSDTDAAHWCRAKGAEIGIEGQLPNIYQLLVMFAEGDVIDSLDPTLAANPTYALGWNGGVNTYRWYLGGINDTWSSTEYSAAYACRVYANGYMYGSTKSNARGVAPVAELSRRWGGFLDDGVTLKSGRKLYRHENGKGSVLEFDMFGKAMKLFVADAVYRTKLVFGAYGTNSSLANFTTTDYPYGSSIGATDEAPVLTDAQLQSTSPLSAYKTDKTARENCDVWATISGTDAVAHCRGLTSIFSGGLDVPNAYECYVLWLESDNIDALDPTAAANPDEKLGKSNTSGGRFYVGGASKCWSSTEYNGSSCINVTYNGNVSYLNKNITYGVVPVRELD